MYADGIGQMNDGPHPRVVSNTISDASSSDVFENEDSLSMLFTIFGQFVDHDLAKTIEEKENGKR